MAALALEDRTLRQAVMLERVKAGEVEAFVPFMREIDRRLREVLTRDGLTAFQRDRAEAMLAEVDRIMAGTLAEFSAQLSSDLREIAALEGAATAAALADAGFRASVPTAGQLWAAANAAPLAAGKGQLLAPFIDAWTATERDRVVGAIRLAVAEGQTVSQTVTAIRGTRANNYADGVLAVTRRNAEAIVRTSVAHVGAEARHATYGANDDILEGYQWSSTLDQRTSSQCQALDGRIFKFGKGPMPPAHINCRSSTIPVLKKEWRALNDGEQRSSINGPVDATQNYYDWLRRQPASFQDEALGATRAKLLRDGGLSPKRFAELQLDRRWQPLTLDEMRTLDPEAFKRAGLG